jgi:glycosyltransferase involved in cell wall biosynthesis
LRNEFVIASGTWFYQKSRRIFTSLAGLHSYKGLHIALKALKVLIDNGFYATLNIAGAQSKGIRQSGYKRYLLRLIKSLKLESHVFWLGALDAKEIVHELQNSDVVLIPSFTESYCMVLYEAISIGIPIVCSSAGAMPEAGRFNHEINYFQPGDYIVAASLLSDMLSNNHELNKELVTVVTAKAALERQLDIYKEIITR